MSSSSFNDAFIHTPRYLTWFKNCTRAPFRKTFGGAGCLYFFGQKRTPIVLLQLKMILHWNVNLEQCPILSTHQVSLGIIVPIHRLSGTFSENNSGTIPSVSENQDKSWKYRFLTYFEACEINRKMPLVRGRPMIPEQVLRGRAV